MKWFGFVPKAATVVCVLECEWTRRKWFSFFVSSWLKVRKKENQVKSLRNGNLNFICLNEIKINSMVTCVVTVRAEVVVIKFNELEGHMLPLPLGGGCYCLLEGLPCFGIPFLRY